MKKDESFVGLHDVLLKDEAYRAASLGGKKSYYMYARMRLTKGQEYLCYADWELDYLNGEFSFNEIARKLKIKPSEAKKYYHSAIVKIARNKEAMRILREYI